MAISPFAVEFIRFLKAVEVPFDALAVGNKSNIVRKAYRTNTDNSLT